MSPIKRIVLQRRVLVGFAGIILLPYALLNGMGLFFLWNSIHNLLEAVVFMAPVVALPLYFMFLWSTPIASVVIWLNFLILHLGYFMIAWPHWAASVTALRVDWPLLLSAILLQFGANQEKMIRDILSTPSNI